MSMPSCDYLTSKHRKFQNEDNLIICNTSSDMIKDLPEHLVSYILSLLPTEDAIMTSMLSKRWRFRWTTISTLDFSDEKVCYDEDGNEYDDYKNGEDGFARIQNFTNYVNRVLNLLKPTSIDKFSIVLEKYSDFFHIYKWISAAVLRNVRDLTLSLGCSSVACPIDIPLNVFQCKTLEVLRLGEGFLLNMSKGESICLPSLKFLDLEVVDICGIPAEEGFHCFPKLETLRLYSVDFVGNDDSVMKLMRHCPVLEDLFISRPVRDNISNTDMCIPALRSVDLYFPWSGGGQCKVEIEAPLTSLRISGWNAPHKILLRKPESLIEAQLGIRNHDRGDYQGENRQYVSDVIKIVEKVKFLTLSCHALDAINISNIKLPLFCNLIQLEVTVECKNLCVLQCLLTNSNNLQTLVIEKRFLSPCHIEEERWSGFSVVPKCLATSLKKVEIESRDGCIDELAMIKGILKYAKVLTKLTAKYKFYGNEVDVQKQNSLLYKISSFSRASAVCQVDCT